MSYDIAFLHTDDVHIPTFQKLVNEIDSSLRVHHEVDASLLSDAISHGMTESLESRIDAAMRLASDCGAKVVVCTCSTIGGVAEFSTLDSAATTMRIDRAMADSAVSTCEEILIVAAVASTLEPTRMLLKQSSRKIGKYPRVTLQLVEDAWPFFQSGENEQYYHCIENFIKKENVGFDCVILAQASMAPVANRFRDTDIRVLASPEQGVRAAIDLIYSQGLQ